MTKLKLEHLDLELKEDFDGTTIDYYVNPETVLDEDNEYNYLKEPEICFSIKDYIKQGCPFSKVIYTINHSMYNDRVLIAEFNKDDNYIRLSSDKFHYSDIISIINIIHKQQEKDSKWCYELFIEHDNEGNGIQYHQEPTCFGYWHDDIINLFSEIKDKINSIILTTSEEEKHLMILQFEWK